MRSNAKGWLLAGLLLLVVAPLIPMEPVQAEPVQAARPVVQAPAFFGAAPVYRSSEDGTTSTPVIALHWAYQPQYRYTLSRDGVEIAETNRDFYDDPDIEFGVTYTYEIVAHRYGQDSAPVSATATFPPPPQ